jgi:hypothetical protein
VKRVLLILVLATIAAALSVGTAAADPVNSPKAITQTFTCDGEQVTLVIRPINAGASAFVADDTGVLTAKGGTVVLTDLETGEQQTFTFDNPGKGFEGDVVTCTAQYTYAGFFWDVIVHVVRSPRGG